MNNFKQQPLKQKIDQTDLAQNLPTSQLSRQFDVNVGKQQQQIQDNLKNVFRNQDKKQINAESSMTFQDKKLFQYNLEVKSTKKQEENCYAIEINKDMSLMIFGCNNKIKVNLFDQGNFKEIQILEGHTDNVQMTSKQFYILSFKLDFENIKICFPCKQPQPHQTLQMNLIILSPVVMTNRQSFGNIIINNYGNLEGHSGQINCLLINNQDDLIISCSWDKTIKFWMKQNTWICNQTIAEHTGAVFQLSLNELQNRLISCGIDQFILVMEYQNKDQKWIIVKKIWTSLQGNRICFLNARVFAFQPDNKDITQIYEINNTKKQYEKKNEIAVQGSYDGSMLFPQKFIKEKSILVSKYYTFINLMRLDYNGQLLSKFTIDFNTYGIFGTISPDGEYLITWNYKTKQIEIRRYIS